MKFKSPCHYPNHTPYQRSYLQPYPMHEYNPYNKVYGGELDHYRMLFIGTVPLIPSKPTPTKEFDIPDRIIMGDTEGKKSSDLSDSESNFHNIKAFLSRHPNIDYKFLIYDTEPIEENRGYSMGATIDPSYRKHVINHDLRTGLPSDIGVFDIVYIDTNTLGIIDSFKKRDDWIILFSPLVSKNGCIISDDDIVLKSEDFGIKGLLSSEVVNNFTGRFFNSSSSFNDTVLNDFMKNVTRHGNHTALLFRVNRPDGVVNLRKDTELLKLKKTWAL